MAEAPLGGGGWGGGGGCAPRPQHTCANHHARGADDKGQQRGAARQHPVMREGNDPGSTSSPAHACLHEHAIRSAVGWGGVCGGRQALAELPRGAPSAGGCRTEAGVRWSRWLVTVVGHGGWFGWCRGPRGHGAAVPAGQRGGGPVGQASGALLHRACEWEGEGGGGGEGCRTAPPEVGLQQEARSGRRHQVCGPGANQAGAGTA
jgi:hypothetical protein